MKKLKIDIESSFKKYFLSNNTNDIIHEAVHEVIKLLDHGTLRVAEKIGKNWQTNDWIKKAIILFFQINKNKLFDNFEIKYFDKIPMKFSNYDEKKFQKSQIRVVPTATVRYGTYIAKNTVLMPSYINIGAYIDKNTMIDTWSTIGSCAQIGKNVHISGGVGIGGVLEPIQSNPTIIEDNCFIGARSEIVEGVIVEKNSVISMGVYIGQSTKIYDRETKKIYYGKIPAGSVVVSGNLISKDKTHSLYSAIIVKKVDERTRKKIQINELLRTI